MREDYSQTVLRLIESLTRDLNRLYELIEAGEGGTNSTHAEIFFIQKVVCDYFSVNRQRMLARYRSPEEVSCRHIAMALTREFTGFSHAQIAAAFLREDHATVIYAVRAVRERASIDPKFAREVDILRGTIGNELARRKVTKKRLQESSLTPHLHPSTGK